MMMSYVLNHLRLILCHSRPDLTSILFPARKDTRILLTVSNLSQLSEKIIPDSIKIFKELFRLDMDNETEVSGCTPGTDGAFC